VVGATAGQVAAGLVLVRKMLEIVFPVRRLTTNEHEVVVEVQIGYVNVQGQSVMVRVVAELTVYVLPPCTISVA
jgi:hypothetical protein